MHDRPPRTHITTTTYPPQYLPVSSMTFTFCIYICEILVSKTLSKTLKSSLKFYHRII